MIRGLYTAATGMTAQINAMDVITNNLSNSDTTGFKKDVAVTSAFSDALTKRIEKENPDRIGAMRLGMAVSEVKTSHVQGSLKETNNSLDIALDGSGYIAVGVLNKDGSSTEKYTRDGSFTLNGEGYLTTKDGDSVLDVSGEAIHIGEGAVRIDDHGVVYVNDEEVAVLKVVDFENKGALKKVGGNLFEAKDYAEEIPFEGKILNGFLESSNVDIIKEMVNMISMSRNYEASQKVIQTHDTILGKAVNDIGRL